MTSKQLLALSGVSKEFPGVKALNNVSFDLNEGEVHAIVGENGAGKSTLMKILSGIYKKDSGIITYKGNSVSIPNPFEAQKLGISIIHQELNLMPHLTVAQNIFIGRENRFPGGFFLNEGKLLKATRDLLKELELNLDPTSIVGELTIAKQQMVEIAKAVSYRGSVVIMDEPTSSLTPAETDSLFKIIRTLKAAGKGVVYISHRLEELETITDRITVLRDGEYVKTLRTAETGIPEVISLMVGRQVAQDQRPEDRKIGSEIVLRVEGLSDRHLLKDVSFELRKGEILGFAGLMGAGRTELARAIMGADPKISGKIFLKGKEVKIKQPSDAVAAGIGYLSEDRKRFGLLLIQDITFNVILSSIPRFSNKLGFLKLKSAAGIARDSIAQLRVRTPSERQYLKNLSGGNQQKVVIAKWLTRDCDVLIFDEPTRGIDVGAKDEIYKLLTKLAEEGKSIIMISSELPEVLRLSDRIAVMCDGRITGIIDNKDADQNKIMNLATKFSDDLATAN
ncbi:MglA ABC-type sugar transport system, ATPase component [Candidatus Nanopelagicaceae bacterium]